MAKFVLKNPVITIDGDDHSNNISEVSIETERDEVEVTAFGAVNKEMLPGLGDATITMQAFQDFASNDLDQNLWVLSKSDTAFTVTVKPTSAAVSATNPLYSMSALLYTYSPISGAVGEASTTELVFRNASQTGLVRSFT